VIVGLEKPDDVAAQFATIYETKVNEGRSHLWAFQYSNLVVVRGIPDDLSAQLATLYEAQNG
jgi:hypothetical protein